MTEVAIVPRALAALGRVTALVCVILAAAGAEAQSRAYARLGAADDDVATEVRADESAGSITFQIFRIGPTTGTAAVSYRTVELDGEATSGVDYTAAEGRVTFAIGDSDPRSVAVTIHDDALDEADELFRFELFDPEGLDIRNATSVGVIVDNDEPPELSIPDRSVQEQAGTMTFDLSLDVASGRQIQVTYRTHGGDATVDADYVAAEGDLTFEPGVRSQSFAVTILDDGYFEPEEHFLVALEGSNVRLPAGDARGTIVDDDPLPKLTVGNARGTEGDVLAFPVTLSATLDEAASVEYRTADDSATVAGGDYVAAAAGSTVSIPAGSDSATIEIATVDDSRYEGSTDERFKVVLENPVNAILDTTEVWGTIEDNEAWPPDLDIAGPSSVGEGDGSVSYTVSKPAAVDVAFDADCATGSPADVRIVNRNLSFPVGTGERNLTVQIIDDTLLEKNEKFTINCRVQKGDGTNYNTGGGRKEVTIIDNEAVPVVSLGQNRSAAEPDGPLEFSVTLDIEPVKAVTVRIATSDDTAEAGPDYAAVDRTLTFNAGETAKTVAVEIYDDSLDEADEVFKITLSDPTNATLGDAEALGTILDDDGEPALTVEATSVRVPEDVGNLEVMVFIAPASGRPVEVNYRTAALTATADEDYQSVSGMIQFGPGGTQATISVPITDDELIEPDESFEIRITRVEHATTELPLVIHCTIEDDDAELPGLSVAGVEADEGAGTMSFPVTLARASDSTVSVSYDLRDGTAQADADYVSQAQGTLTFDPGETGAAVTVSVIDDSVHEGDETFEVRLSQPVNALLNAPDHVATGTILDNDPAPVLSIEDASADEGDMQLSFPVALSGPVGSTYSVVYETVADSADETDYAHVRRTLRLMPGELAASIDVRVKDDIHAEVDESFFLRLTEPSAGTLARTDATGTIVNDDPLPTLHWEQSAHDCSREGVQADGFVTVMPPRPDEYTPVRVDWITASGTATSGRDFTLNRGVLIIDDDHSTVRVKTLDDEIDEAKEYLNVRLTPSGAISAIPPDSARLYLCDDDDPPSIGVKGAAAREGDSAVFDLRLSAKSGKPIAVPYEFRDITAVSGTDYDGTSGTVQFDPGTTRQTIAVPLFEDDQSEADRETFELIVKPSRNFARTERPPGSETWYDDYAWGGVATGTIEDGDANPTLTVTPGQAYEEDGAIEFDATLSLSSADLLRVRYWTVAGTAMPGSDYLDEPSGTMEIARGSVSQTIVIPLVDDDSAEGAETFEVRLSEAEYATLVDEPAVIIDTPSVTGTILDSDSSDLELNVSDAAAVSESDGALEFTVTLAGAPAYPVHVDYGTVDGTATSSDYTPASGTLTFAPGGELSRTVEVTVRDDALHENDESLELVLSNPRGGNLGNGRARGTIRDNDPLTVDIADAQGSEGASFGFLVTLDPEPGIPVNLSYSTADGTAVAGSDYQHKSAPLSFLPGETEKTARVRTIDDRIDEPEETFEVRLGNLPADVGGRHAATGTIRADHDPQPVVGLVDRFVRGVEGEELAFGVRMTPQSGRTVTVNYATLPDQTQSTATPDVDFTHVQDTLTFLPGETERTIRVTTLQDDVQELSNPELFRLELTDPAHATLGTASATGFIWDDDGPPGKVSLEGQRAGEGDYSILFFVSLDNAASREVKVRFRTEDGTATGGEDYRPVDTEVVIPVGGQRETVHVRLIDDSLREAEEQFTATITVLEGGATVERGTATGTIVDDDEAPRVSLGDASAVENEGALRFPVALSNPAGLAVSVGLSTSDVEARAAVDYRATSQTLTFEPGDAEQRFLDVPLIDDDLSEPEETLRLTVVSVTNARGLGEQALGTIVDDDPPTATIRALEESVREGSPARFEVALDGAGGTALDVSVELAETGGYLASPPGSRTVTIPPGARTAVLEAATVSDDAEGDDGTVTAVLVAGSGYSPGEPSRATVRIVDGTEILLTAVRPAAAEEGGELIFPVRLSAARNAPVTVDFETVDGTALQGADYTGVAGTLRFEAGATEKTVAVPLVDDALHELDETVDLVLSNAGGATLGGHRATGTILDNDSAPALSVSNASAREDAGEMGFEVRLAETSGVDVAVEFRTRDGTATAGQDYSATAGTLTFGAGETAKTIRVLLLDDAIDEPDETFELALSNAGGASPDGERATGTIVDDDGEPALSVADASVAEDAGELTFEVRLSTSSGLPVTVEYATSDHTATAGADYEPASGTLGFEPGETVGRVTVAILQDDEEEPDETFFLRLSQPVGAMLSESEATGTIRDDDGSGDDWKPSLEEARTALRVLVFDPSAHPFRQGFVRIINHSAEAGGIRIQAIDDAGMRARPVTLTIGARAAAHFNSDDLEAGNALKGLADGVGPPSYGNWRMDLWSALDIEVLSYARTRDGFVTSLHDAVPVEAGVYRGVVFFNRGDNIVQESRLRLINPRTVTANVRVTGVDDAGKHSGEVRVALPAHASTDLRSAELEAGTGRGIESGALGTGEGRWRLQMVSDTPIIAMSMLESRGNLTNLSTADQVAGQAPGSRAVLMFPPASDPERQGFVRVINYSPEAGEVRIEARDDSDTVYEPLLLAIGAESAAHFNSNDLETGNPDKGLTGSTGAGTGAWWLELTSELDIDVLAYIRNADSFVTAIHDLVPASNGLHRVAFFNPASNFNQVSRLRLVNPHGEAATVRIRGVDDANASPGSPVVLRIPPSASRTVTSAELETGAAGLEGALGDGQGKWRLFVTASRPIFVMSLLVSPTGHLTNLSSAPAWDARR